MKIAIGVPREEDEEEYQARKENKELLERVSELEQKIWNLIAERDGLREKNRRIRKDLDEIKSLIDSSETREFQIAAPYGDQ